MSKTNAERPQKNHEVWVNSIKSAITLVRADNEIRLPAWPRSKTWAKTIKPLIHPLHTHALSPEILPEWLKPLFYHTWFYLGLSVLLLVLDVVTGPYLLFPIFFVVPVSLCAWYHQPRLAYQMALMLPMGRFAIAEFIEKPQPFIYMAANAFIRV